jgi:hypothetical protein
MDCKLTANITLSVFTITYSASSSSLDSISTFTPSLCVMRVRRRDQNQYWCMTRGYILWLLLCSCVYTQFIVRAVCANERINAARARGSSGELILRLRLISICAHFGRSPPRELWIVDYSMSYSGRLLVSQHGGRRGLPPVCVSVCACCAPRANQFFTTFFHKFHRSGNNCFIAAHKQHHSWNSPYSTRGW